MTGDMVTLDWVFEESIRRLRRKLVFAKRMPPVVRVRRRGFRRGVRRGDDVRQPGGVYHVLRRSRRHLWLEQVRDGDGTPLVGDTIRVRLPERYRV